MRAISLFLSLSLARGLAAAGAEDPSLLTWLAFLWQDVVVVLAFGAFVGIVRREWFAWGGYSLCVVYAAVNQTVIQVLATPLTLPMLRATDAALSDSILHYLAPANLFGPAVVVAAAVVLPLLLARVRSVSILGRGGTLWLVPFGAACLIAGPIATGRVTADRHANGIVAMLGSLLPRVACVDAADAASFRRLAGEFATRPASPRPELAALAGVARGRNVVLVVLESVGAGYLRPYGAALDPMPTLTALAQQSVLCKNAYAVYPESIKGLVALQSSRHPAIDTQPEQYRALAAPALASVLAGAGYRTGLFHSGRFDYLGMQAVIENAGYATRVDAGGISGTTESSFGVDETATVDAALGWVDRAAGRPFFLTYMPVAGHHPYDSPGVGPFPATELIGAYRNAIYFADRAIARLVEGLEAKGVWSNTLLVVVGDHGQAFGQHDGNFGHTFHLFEENVHVPLLFALPGVTRRCVSIDSVTSHVDVAPTVLDLLGLTAPSAYEGSSILRGGGGMALLFTDYASAYVGARDGAYKFIHQVESGASWLFDVTLDPSERRNLAADQPGRVAAYRRHLLTWSRAQRARVSAEPSSGAWRMRVPAAESRGR